MGNQARVAPNTTVVSTSTRNFPNRLGQGSNVYLASAELASVAAVLGKLPTNRYMEYANKIDSMATDIYRYLNFDKMEEFQKQASTVKIQVAQTNWEFELKYKNPGNRGFIKKLSWPFNASLMRCGRCFINFAADLQSLNV